MFLGIYIELKLPNLSFKVIPENFLVKAITYQQKSSRETFLLLFIITHIFKSLR